MNYHYAILKKLHYCMQIDMYMLHIVYNIQVEITTRIKEKFDLSWS